MNKLSTFTLAALLLAPLAALATTPQRPNVVVICTDQQHAGMLGCAGNRWLKTPAMDNHDKLAEGYLVK